MAPSRFLLACIFAFAARANAFVEFDHSFVLTLIDVPKGRDVLTASYPGQYYAYATFSEGPINEEYLKKVTIIDDDTPAGSNGTSILDIHAMEKPANSPGTLGRLTLNVKQGGRGVWLRNTNPSTPITPTQRWVVYIVDVNFHKCPVYDMHGVDHVQRSTAGKECPNTATILNAAEGFSLRQFSANTDTIICLTLNRTYDTWDVFTAPADYQKEETKVLSIQNNAHAFNSFAYITGPIATLRHNADPLLPMQFNLSILRKTDYDITVAENAAFSVSSPGYATREQSYSYAWPDDLVPFIQRFTMSGTATLHIKVRGYTNANDLLQSILVRVGVLERRYNGTSIEDSFDAAVEKVQIGVTNGAGRLPLYTVQVEQSSPNPQNPSSSPKTDSPSSPLPSSFPPSSPIPSSSSPSSPPASSSLPSDSSSPQPGESSTKGGSLFCNSYILSTAMFFGLALRM